MKILKYILVCAITFVFVIACNEGIDPITSVAPGTDQTAPTVTVNSPDDGGVIKVPEGKGLAVAMEVADDIELESVSIILDGTEVENITGFTDYRRYAPLGGYIIDGVENGIHTLKVTATDLTGKSTSSAEISFTVIIIGEFVPAYGEIFYMSFDGSVFEFASLTDATMIGTTGYAEGKVGQAYAGATDSYLSFPIDDIAGEEFSATFWININPVPDRAGMLTVSAPDPTGLDRTKGFRLLREGGATNQILKLNVGNGTVDSWFDGGAAATLNPELVDWVHIAITISTTNCALYFDGVVVSEDVFYQNGPISWTDCESLSIASGAPNFLGWAHYSDLSLYDELRIFDKALTQEEIQAIIDAEQ